MEFNIFFIVVGVIFLLLLAIASGFEYAVFFNMMRCRAKNSNNLTGSQTAQMLLEKLELGDIQVKRSNWFAGLFWSNYYNAKKKTIYLKGNIYNKASIGAIGIATQQVALALQDKNNDKGFSSKSKFRPYTIAAPILFVPISLLGIIIDLIMTKSLGIVTLVFISLAFIGLIVSFILLLKTLPAERKANKDAVEIMEQTNLLSGTEINKVKKLYNITILKYVADYLIMTVYFVGLFFKIVGKVFNKK